MTPHITANIFLSEKIRRPHTNDGIKSGYAPHHKFSNIDSLVSGFHDYGDTQHHYVGEKLNAKIRFASWEYISDLVKVGDTFQIKELEMLIGSGVVLLIES